MQFSKRNKTAPLLPLPEINFNLPRRICVTRDQPRPGSFLKKREEPGNEVGSIMENINELMEKLSQSKSERQQKHLSAMISIASYIINNGLLVKTQNLAKEYKILKGLKESSRMDSSQLLETVGKHLNIMQIYIRGTGYVTENRGKDIMEIAESLQNIDTMDQIVVNNKVKEAIGDKYKTVIEYLDSKRDRDTLKAVLTEITSATFMSKLAGVQDKRSFQRAKDLVNVNLTLFEDMKKTMDQSSRGSSDVAERKKRQRTLDKMKLEKLRHLFTGRGRDLKCEEFPDLVGIIEFTFGESDRLDRAGGGLESHPRLIDTVLYRAVDNNTTMKHARETILALAPEGFNISLSSCFNYTQNYREGTYQAKRHHSGRGINACLSLHKPPQIGVEQLVVNLHWSTQNVNLTIDYAYLFPNNFMLDSKDAKAKVQSDVAPVQRPGKTWRTVNLPDHDWSKSTQTSVTPMTHLLLETDMTLQEITHDVDLYSVRRTGKAVTFLNLSFFEPETAQRAFNEIFLLLTNPALDHYFRNPDTGKLKENFVFIVDNGPSEAPANPLVKMLLVRLLRILRLKSITQNSFAEHHSKRNFVERVHAVHNAALSNEQFSSKAIHKEFEVGDEKHLENMEDLAAKVQECLSHTQYGGKPCLALRGIGKEDNFIFNDSDALVNFLAKNENQKNVDGMSYSPAHNDLWFQVSTLWDLDYDFVGSYAEDYQILENTWQEDGEVTSLTDKYSTTIFNPDMMNMLDTDVLKMQPVPDYIRWLKTGGELHYLPLEKLKKIETEVIDKTRAAFLPSKLLKMVFKVLSNGTDHVLPSIGFLSWCSVDDIRQFYSEFKEKLDRTFSSDKEREYWSQEELYKKNKKEDLQHLCKKNKIDSNGKKHECVRRLAQHLNDRYVNTLHILFEW